MEIGDLIKKYRIENKMTQVDLANKIGVIYQQIQKWETGERNPGTKNIFLLIDILEIPFDEIKSAILKR